MAAGAQAGDPSSPGSLSTRLGGLPVVAGHVATALRAHRQWAARVQLWVPPEVAFIERIATDAARTRQAPTAIDDLFQLRDRPVVAPLAMTYADVAEALSISVRSVERLVGSGALRTVRIGGAARVTVAGLADFVDTLGGTCS